MELPSGKAVELLWVGRQHEWELIQASWRTATRERAHFALIAGEARIGKSPLAEELLNLGCPAGRNDRPNTQLCGQGRLAFAPVADWLRADAFQGAVRRLDAGWRTEVARILPQLLAEAPDLPPPEPLTASWQRRRFFEAPARAVVAASQPIALLIG